MQTLSTPHAVTTASAWQIRQWLDELQSDGCVTDLRQLLKYQRYTHLFDLTPAQTIQSKLAGSYLAKSKGRGMEFDEVRHYQNGDDVRTIDWRVTARTGKVHTKLFREEKERPVFILTDLNPSMQFGSSLLLKSVQACHVAAMIAWHVKKSGDKLGGVIFNSSRIHELKPASRSVAVLRYLHFLIELQQQAITSYQASPVITSSQGLVPNLAIALTQLRRLMRPGSLLFVISDFQQLDPESKRHLQAIRLHNEVRFCQISDPLEAQLPGNAVGIAQVQTLESTLMVNLASSALRQQFQSQQQAFQQNLSKYAVHLGCRHWHFSASRPLLHQLHGQLYV